jgi:hypothetical protein
MKLRLELAGLFKPALKEKSLRPDARSNYDDIISQFLCENTNKRLLPSVYTQKKREAKQDYNTRANNVN